MSDVSLANIKKNHKSSSSNNEVYSQSINFIHYRNWRSLKKNQKVRCYVHTWSCAGNFKMHPICKIFLSKYNGEKSKFLMTSILVKRAQRSLLWKTIQRERLYWVTRISNHATERLLILKIKIIPSLSLRGYLSFRFCIVLLVKRKILASNWKEKERN